MAGAGKVFFLAAKMMAFFGGKVDSSWEFHGILGFSYREHEKRGALRQFRRVKRVAVSPGRDRIWQHQNNQSRTLGFFQENSQDILISRAKAPADFQWLQNGWKNIIYLIHDDDPTSAFITH